MSRPILSSAARRLSQHQPKSIPSPAHRPFSTSRPTLSHSASTSCRISAHRSLSTSPFTPGKGNSTTARHLQSSPSPVALPQQHYAFSSTAGRPAARVVQNPRTDDDGNELLMDISSVAAERLRQITDPTSSPSATAQENPYHHLRITVTSGGCHGFQYLMSLESASKIDPEEDTVFEAEPTADSAGQAKVVMDEPSLELLSGSTVDFTTELIGSQFKIANNPRATSNCGCGTSFDVKD